MSEEMQKVEREDLLTAILEAATETIQTVQNIMQAAQVAAEVTADVIQTLQQHGILIGTGDTRDLRPSQQIAACVSRRLLTEHQHAALPEEPIFYEETPERLH